MTIGAPAWGRRGGPRVWKHPLFWTAVAAVVAAWPIATLVVGDPFASPSPRLALVPVSEDPTGGPVFTVPAFTHVDHRGQPFGAQELDDEVWVASFFFTSCPTICPKLTEALVKLQGRLDAAQSPVKMVTFTVDPETDTPEVLAAHAREVGAGPRWTFLTGEADALARTIVEGFKQPMGAPDGASDAETTMAIAHGTRFVLVDRARGVRGLYETDEAGLDALVRDAAILAARERG